MAKQFTDQMGNVLELKQTPIRVISLVPSQTELLYYLEITPIAQTIFCIHPSVEFKKSTKIGGTKKLNLDKIRDLKPDLIVGNKEENNQDQIEELQVEFPVWMSDVNSLDDAYEMMVKLGALLNKSKEANLLKLQIQERFNRLITPNTHKPTVLYFIWNNPVYGVANNTFIHDVLVKSGFYNMLIFQQRYPEIALEDIAEIGPEYIFLSSEPFPFNETHQKNLKSEYPDCEPILVDGEMFSWYGNRLLDTPAYITALKDRLKK